MSIMNKTKQFFGLGPYEIEHDDPYYTEAPRYEGSVAYAPKRRYEPIYEDYPEEAPVNYATTVTSVKILNYNDAVKIGADMAALPSDEAKRIIDFAAGLCYALRGKMDKLEPKIFVITPEDCTIHTHDLRRAVNLD